MAATIEPDRRPLATIKLLVLIGVAGVMATLILLHVSGVNGPWYWTWPWRRLGWQIYPLMAAAAIPLLAGQWVRYRLGRLWPAIALLMAATFAMELAAISQQRLGIGRIGAIVENSVNTSYYSAAKVIVEQQAQGVTLTEWLTNFPELLPYMQVHAK